MVEKFDTLGDWTASGSGSGALSIDPTVKTDQTSSVKLVTSGVGSSNEYGTKTISRSFANDVAMFVDLYIPDLATILAPTVYLSADGTFTNYFSYSINTGTLHTGYNRVPLPRASWSAHGTVAWTDTMVRLRVRCDAATDTVGTLHYCQFVAGRYGRPKFVFRFDDIRDTQYTTAYPIMRAYGFRGSCFVIADKIGASGGYMTLAQMQELHDAGWDMCNHTKTHTDLSTQTLAQQHEEMKLCSDTLKNNGFTRRNEHLHMVWPFGGNDANTQQAMLDTGIISGGSIKSPLSTPYPILEPHFLTIDNIAQTVTLANALARVDRVIADGAQSCFLFHIITASAVASTEWPTADFQSLCDYVSRKRDQIDVVTWTEFYDEMAHNRRQLFANPYPLAI